MNDRNSSKPRVLIRPIAPDAKLPRYAKPGDAGADLFAIETTTLNPGQRAIVGTGLQMAIPQGFEGQIRPRSGNAFKLGLTVLNAPGTIDSGFRGEVGVILINLGHSPIEIKAGMAIAQLVIAPVSVADFFEIETLPESDRGSNGWGSTGC